MAEFNTACQREPIQTLCMYKFSWKTNAAKGNDKILGEDEKKK